jgi:uncharacterized Zn finger protein (UPF0148 family)
MKKVYKKRCTKCGNNLFRINEGDKPYCPECDRIQTVKVVTKLTGKCVILTRQLEAAKTNLRAMGCDKALKEIEEME